MTLSIIRPPIIYPVLPKLPDITTSLQILAFCACLGAALLFAFLLEGYMSKRWQRKKTALNMVLPVIACAFLTIRFGIGMEVVKGFILFLLLLFAANSDLQSREVDDYIPIMIGIMALTGVKMSELPAMLFAAAIITAPQLAIAVLKPNTYGGADIKLMATCSLLLGLSKGLFAIIAGLLLAVIVTIIARKVKKQSVKESFALIPYLAAGSFIVYLI